MNLLKLSPQDVQAVPDWFRRFVAFQSGGSGQQGYRTVLFGDSMTDLYEQVQAPIISPYSYDAAAGILTISFANHGQAVGWFTTYWDRLYPALTAAKRYRVVERVDANTIKLNIGANLPGVPNGSLSLGTASMRPENLRGAETWFTWLQYISGNLFDVKYNGAQSGDTTAQCLSRMDVDCLAYNPDVVFMQMPGINDSGALSAEATSANQAEILRRLSDNVPLSIILTTTPVATGEGRATLPIMQRVVASNRKWTAYAKTLPGIAVIDAYSQIIDPTDATGLALANMLRTSDNIHYAMRGGKKVATYVWSKISKEFASETTEHPSTIRDSYLSSAVTLSSVSRTNGVITATATAHGILNGEVGKLFAATGASEALNDWVPAIRVSANTLQFVSPGPDGSITGTITFGTNNNLMSNPLMMGAGAGVGGGITGNYAAGLSAFRSGTRTVVGLCSGVNHPSGFGQMQRSTITSSAASDRLSVVSAIPDAVLHPKAGRAYQAVAELRLTGVSGSNLSEIRFNMTATLDGVLYQTWALAGYASGAGLDADPETLYLKTPPLVLPPYTSCTQFRVDCTLSFSASGTPLVAELSRMAIREISEYP